MNVSAQLLDRLSAPDAEQVRLRMSWEEFLAFIEDYHRAEWVDGEVVVSPPVGWDHGVITLRLGSAISVALPGLLVGTEVGVWLPRNRLRGPDLAAFSSKPSGPFLSEAPVLVVELLSSSTRGEDTIRKAPEYAAAGIGQFWVVDPEGHRIDVYENVDGAWELLLHLDVQRPTGEVAVGEHGVVPLDLAWILPI